MRVDPLLDHSLRAHSSGRMKSQEYDIVYHINSLGQRDDEPIENDSETVLILGDSFMEGYGVERGQILADRLEAITPWNVINGGVKSYSPLLEYLYLKARGLSQKPDTVVLFLDLSDPANDMYYGSRLIRDDSHLPLAIKPRVETHELLYRSSALYAYAIHLQLKYGNHEDKGYAGAAGNLAPLFAGNDDIPDSEYLPRWEKSFEYLKLIRDLLLENKIGFVLVTYPYGHQVSPEAWKVGRVAHGFPPGISSDRPFRLVESWARSESIAVISLDHAFRSAPSPEKFYFTYDGHWTAAGHAFAAEAVRKHLK